MDIELVEKVVNQKIAQIDRGLAGYLDHADVWIEKFARRPIESDGVRSSSCETVEIYGDEQAGVRGSVGGEGADQLGDVGELRFERVAGPVQGLVEQLSHPGFAIDVVQCGLSPCCQFDMLGEQVGMGEDLLLVIHDLLGRACTGRVFCVEFGGEDIATPNSTMQPCGRRS